LTINPKALLKMQC